MTALHTILLATALPLGAHAPFKATWEALDKRIDSWPAVAWEQLGPGQGGTCFCVGVAAADTSTLFVGNDMGASYMSWDRGLSWRSVNDPDSGVGGLWSVETVAFAPSDPNVVYAAGRRGQARSVDRGRSWTFFGDKEVQKWPTTFVAVSPVDADHVYVGSSTVWETVSFGYIGSSTRNTGRLWESIDAGRTLKDVSQGLDSGAVVMGVAELRPDGKTLDRTLAATSKGLYARPASGGAWRPSQDGLPHGHCHDMAVSRDAAAGRLVVYVLLQTWYHETKSGWESRGGLYRSDDLGRTWRDANGGLYLPIRQLPERSQYDASVCLHMRPRVQREYARLEAGGKPAGSIRDLGQRLRRELRKKPPEAVPPERLLPAFAHLEADPRDARVVYLGTQGPRCATGFEPHGIWKTTDAGRTWKHVTRFGKGWDDPRLAPYMGPGPRWNMKLTYYEKWFRDHWL